MPNMQGYVKEKENWVFAIELLIMAYGNRVCGNPVLSFEMNRITVSFEILENVLFQHSSLYYVWGSIER